MILLALELEGVVVTADKGIVNWAEKLGIRWIESVRFRDVIDSLIDKGGTPQA